MKINKRFFIVILLVLMLFLCVNASSATEPLKDTLKADIADGLAIDEVSIGSLGVSGDTLGVDENSQGQNMSVSYAVGAADGGETKLSENDNHSPDLKDASKEEMMLPEGTIYVSENGDDANDGSSEANAIASLSHAVEIASSRDLKTATVFVLNGDYVTGPIDDNNTSLTVIGQEKGKVTIHGTGNYIFSIDHDNLVWKFENLDFVGVSSTASTSAALFLEKSSNYTINNCNFRNIKARYGAMDIASSYANVTNVTIENITAEYSSAYSLSITGSGQYYFDNIKIKNCRLDESYATENPATHLRAIFYVNNNDATVTLNNSEITDIVGPLYGGIIESTGKVTVINTVIANNVVNTSDNGNNGGEYLIWARRDTSDINIINCVITNNTIIKSGKGLFYNQNGKINVEYSDISGNKVNKFVGGSATITADNNWWGTNDQPDSKIDKWVIMNVDVDDSNLSANNEITLTFDFNHVNTSSGKVEELTGGEIPKDSYSIGLSAKNGEITPSSVVVEKGQVKEQTFTVTEVNDLITVSCDGANVEITIEGIAPYRGIIYVNKTGNNDNNGSIDAPVADLATAIELANNAIGQIVIYEGTYAGNDYHVTKDLNITGVGKVIIDGEGQGQLFYTGYTTAINSIILTNLTLAGASSDYGQAINSYARELVLTNVNMTNNPGEGSLIISNGKLTMNNCIITNHNGGNVITVGSGDLIINNTLFENNFVTDSAIVYSTSIGGNAIVENTNFTGNTGRLGIFKVNKKTTVKDSRFIDNENTNAYGGAISDFDTLTVTNSAFINNKAFRSSGAINVGYNRQATITQSTFINNTAGDGYYGDAISNTGKLTINYCVLVSNADHSIIYSESEEAVNAQYNWWGTNDNPKSLNGVGTYEDDYGEDAYSEIDASNWVYMKVTPAEVSNALNVGDTVEVTVDFTNYMDSTKTLNALSESIPEVNVAAKAIGDIDNDELTTSNGIAKFVYTATAAGEDTINITSTDANVQIPVTVSSEESIIYVDGENGVNTNDGKTRENAVKTIEHAVEIADGKIIVLAGEYTVTSTLNITKDLEIIGEGDVSVKSDAKYTVEVYDDWDEEWISETHYSLIENNANLKISNIKFTQLRASITDAFIQNNGNLLVNTSEFANIKVTSSKGVIQNALGSKLEVNGTKFTSASGTYGAINNNGELLVNNSKFFDNDRSAESGVYSTAITSYNKATILNSEFKNNKGTVGGAIYVMYSYLIKVNPVMDIDNCRFIENNAPGSSYSDGSGAAVKCNGAQITLTITNSTFDKNSAKKGGAIFAEGTVTVDQCVFIGDTASFGEAVYVNSGTATVQNSIILDGTSSIWAADGATVTANDNWWGSNDKPNDNVDSWVKMNAAITPETAEAGDEVTVTAVFDNDKLPEGVINVTFTSNSAKLNETVTVNNAQASVAYTIDEDDKNITASSGNAQVVIPIEAPVPDGTIYVSPNGDDTKDGLSQANAIKNLTKAVELAGASIGKIVLLEGTHTITEMLAPTKDLDITGQGAAIVDGNSMRIIQTSAGLNLTNIEFINGYSKSSNLINIMSGASYLSLNNVKFHDNVAKQGVAAQTGTKLIINNSKFYGNDFTAASNSNGLVYINSADAIIVNTEFRDNKGKSASAIGISRASSASTGSLVMNNVTVANNLADVGNGIVSITGTNTVVEITNSTFINNLANASASHVDGNGGAIYMAAAQGKLTVNQSVFINNTGNNPNSLDTGIFANKGTVEIANSILLGNATRENCVVSDGAAVTAEDNWWGNNEKANTKVDVLKIVKMNATLTPQDAQAGDAVTINISFDNDKLPKDVITVTLTSSSGSLNEIITMNGAEVSVDYDGNPSDSYISAVSSSAEIMIPFDLEAGLIFVLPGADDTNPGTRDAPVGTISKALELASRGKIVLLEGIHPTGNLGTISDDLTIIGEGNAVIDAQNSNRIFFVGESANVVIENVTMINGYTADESGALLGNNNNLTLINCVLANSSTGPENNGGAIYNGGKLTLINTIIANCAARAGGAIFTQDPLAKGNAIKLINSSFENNFASGNDNLGGGAIFAQQIVEFTIENTSFINNEAGTTSSGGAIFISHSSADIKITDSQFIANHANGQSQVGGGAIYRAATTNYEKQGSMTITGTLFENNTCNANGGAIYARATTVNVANSVFVNNTDANGLAVYGYKTDLVNPTIILNDNWWGSNDSPKDLIGGNGYRPTLNRWAILTFTNDTPIVAGETVKLTVSINNYTDGTNIGTLSKPITVKRSQTIRTTSDEINGVLENGEFTYDYTVSENENYIAAIVDGETQVLFAISSPVTIEMDDITAHKYDKVSVEINVTSAGVVDAGKIELYVNGERLIATIEVHDGKAIGEVVISEENGEYNLTARYVEGSPLFDDSQTNATLTVSGISALVNETFFNFFDEEGLLRDEITADELIFHGDFSGLGVNTITIPRSISIKGDNAVLYDMAISLQDSEITLNDMKFIASGDDFAANSGAVIFASGENIELNNVSVNYTAPSDAAAYAVLVKSAGNFKLSDSTIIFDANNNAELVQQAALVLDEVSDVEINANTISAVLPSRDVAYGYYYPDLYGIYQDLVLGIGIQGGENINFTDNEVNVDAKSAIGTYATLDSFMIDGAKNVLISKNNFTQTDFTGEGKAGFSNVVDLYNFEGVTVQNNNILINTSTGVDGAGTAYPIQATGPYTGLVVDNNNLTAISKGPALGIYSQNYDGMTDSVITNNFINVTGYASENEYALVSGMELQDTFVKVYNNTIYSQSISDYADTNELYGISYAQYTSGTHTYDIKDNTIYTDGKYAIYLQSAQDSNVTGNTLYAHELTSDDAVNISSGKNNVVKDNLPSSELVVVIKVDDIAVGEDAIINVTVEGNVNGVATVIVNGEPYTVPVINGFGNVSVSDLTIGEYTVNVTFVSTDVGYGNGENTTAFNVTKIASDINITVSCAEAGNDTVIGVSIPGASGEVVIFVNGNAKSIVLDENGNANYTIENISAGDYYVSAVYFGDENHERAYKNATFTVDRLSSDVNVTVTAGKAGEKSTVKVNMTEGATGTVVIDVNGTKYVIDLAESDEIELILGAGEYPVVASYSGDDKYNASVSEGQTIVVDGKKEANIEIAVPDDIKVGDNIIINITADTDADVTVTINGVPQEIVSGNGLLGVSLRDLLRAVENGKVLYTVPGAGVYNITVTAKETEEYLGATVTEIFEVTKKDAVLDITPITDAKVGDKVTIVVVNETDGTLTIKVNGEEVSGVYEITKAGSYTVNVESASTDSYNAGFASYTFTVEEPVIPEPADADIEVVVGEDNSTADVELPEDASGNVTVKVDGRAVYSGPANETSPVDLTGLNAGDHIVEVVYSGDDKYATKTITKDITIPHGEIPEPDNNVTVIVDGEEYPGVIVDGKVVIDTNRTEPVVVETVVVDGVEYPVVYVNGTAVVNTNKIEPAKEQSDAVINIPDDIKAEESASVEVSVDNATGNVSVIVDGVETVVPLVNGSASVPISNVSAGGHSVVVIYSGDETHAPTHSASSFTVPAEEVVQPVATEFIDIIVYRDSNVSAVLVDKTGNAIVNATILYAVGSEFGSVVTDSNGLFTVKGESGLALTISYVGDDNYLAINTTIRFDNAPAVRQSTVIVGNNFTQYALEYDSGERGQNFTVQLTDANGNILVNKTVLIGYNGKTLTRVTNATGHASVQINLRDANRLTFAVTFLGDDEYNATMSVYLITIVKKPVTITAAAKTYKATAKTKKYTVTLKTIKGSSADGKTYFAAGKKVTMKINGKTYTAKTNAKGQATFSLKINKKGKFSAVIKYAGTNTYAQASKNVKITIK